MRLRRHKNPKYIFKSPWKRLGATVLDAVGKTVFVGRSRRPWDLSQTGRILLIRMDQIGDAIFSAPATEYLREIFPRARIDFLAGPWSAPLVKTFPGVSEVLVFEKNWFSPRFESLDCARSTKEMVKILRRNRYDLGIDLRGDLRNILLMRAAGIRRTIGYGITGGSFLLDRAVPYDFFAHQVDLNGRLMAEVAKGLGLPTGEAPTKGRQRPWLFCPDAIKEAVFDQGWRSVAHPRILVHAEAGYPSKRWGKERFARLLAALLERPVGIGLVGQERDDLCQDPILKKHSDRILDLRGKTNLLELLGLIAQSDLLVGNDSAPAHIAASVGTPCVVLFSGANDPARWRPMGEDVRLLFHPVRCSPCESRQCLMPSHECMDAISVHEVEGVVMEMLSAKGFFS